MLTKASFLLRAIGKLQISQSQLNMPEPMKVHFCDLNNTETEMQLNMLELMKVHVYDVNNTDTEIKWLQ